VIAPLATAELTAFIAAAMSWAFSPRALSRGGALDRRQCEFYRAFAARRQDALEAKPNRSRVAAESALHVKASDSPARNAAAASVALLREPVCRPAGLPNRPFSYGRPRARPSGLGEIPSAIVISSIPIGGPFGSRPRPGVCNEK
jgi:hypothetical protein